MRSSLKSAWLRTIRLAERLRLSADQAERSRLANLTDEQLWREILGAAEEDGIEQALEMWRQLGGTPADLYDLRKHWNQRMEVH